jgi:hypothetical protein
MDVYSYQAALICDACGEVIQRELDAQGIDDTGDSDHYPQGPYADGGGEADTPQHCDRGEDCLCAEDYGQRRAVGAFLENPLTVEGVGYVAQKLRESPRSQVVRAWAEHYGIDAQESAA